MDNKRIQAVAQNISVGTYSYQVEANSINDFIFVITSMTNSVSTSKASSGGDENSSNSANYSASNFYNATYSNGTLTVTITNVVTSCGTWAHTLCGRSNVYPVFTIYKV